MDTKWEAYFKMVRESEDPGYSVYDENPYENGEGPIRAVPVI